MFFALLYMFYYSNHLFCKANDERFFCQKNVENTFLAHFQVNNFGL